MCLEGRRLFALPGRFTYDLESLFAEAHVAAGKYVLIFEFRLQMIPINSSGQTSL
jgi:hypothetical protein